MGGKPLPNLVDPRGKRSAGCGGIKDRKTQLQPALFSGFHFARSKPRLQIDRGRPRVHLPAEKRASSAQTRAAAQTDDHFLTRAGGRPNNRVLRPASRSSANRSHPPGCDKPSGNMGSPPATVATSRNPRTSNLPIVLRIISPSSLNPAQTHISGEFWLFSDPGQAQNKIESRVCLMLF